MHWCLSSHVCVQSLCISQPAWGLHQITTYTQGCSIQNHNQPTPYESKEREWDKRGVEEFKSLPLFRLVVAVVCCLVFPLWVNEHTSSENITTLSWFQAAVYTYTQIHKHAHTDRQRIMFTGTRLYVVSGRLTKHHSWPLLSSLIQWGGSEWDILIKRLSNFHHIPMLPL